MYFTIPFHTELMIQRMWSVEIRRTFFINLTRSNFSSCGQSTVNSCQELSGGNENDQEPDTLCRRIERLPREKPVGSAFQSWMGDGFPVHKGDIFHTINRLRRRKFNKRALEAGNVLVSDSSAHPTVETMGA